MIFSRTFFNVVLDDILNEHAQQGSFRIVFVLMDGTSLEVCHIEELKDAFMIAAMAQKGVACHRRREGTDGESCMVDLEIIPYFLIQRIRLLAVESGEGPIGFHLTPLQKKRQSEGKKPLLSNPA